MIFKLLIKSLLSCFFVLISVSFLVAKSTSDSPKQGTIPVDKSLLFTENKNQWPKEVKYRADLQNGKLYLQPNGFLFQFYENGFVHPHGKAEENSIPDKIKAHAYSVTFTGANPNPTFGVADGTPEIRNYYLGNDPSRWASGVKSYREVKYQEIYPKTDLHVFEKDEHLKYEFILQPGADPAKIKMQYKGVDKMYLTEGDLVIKTSVAEVKELKPYAYQVKNGKEVEVPCSFELTNQTLTFKIQGDYDKKLPLVIDPTLVYSSYSGSSSNGFNSGDNWGFTATYDQAGNIYSGGVVFSPGFPVTTGAYDLSFNNGADISLTDIGILKYNPAATGAQSLVYATYIGGSQTEAPHSMIVNNSNELIIMGTTSSFDYPRSALAFNKNFNGGVSFFNQINGISYANGSDIIVTKLNSNGTSLLASTFLGGSSNDGIIITNDLVKNYGDQFRGDVFTDSDNNIYIASSTSSSNFPAINGFQSNYGGGTNDAVICKLNSDLSAMLWSSFLGGTGADAAYSIQADASFVYVTGGTSSSNLTNTSGSFKTFYGGLTDGFVSKITKAGSLIRTSYIGTSNYDQAYFIQLDVNSNVYLFGQSLGNYPVSNGVYSNFNGKQFIQKLNTDLTQSIFSTVFGSNNYVNISPTAFLVDDCERILIAGWGGTTSQALTGGLLPYNTFGLPITPGAYRTSTDGSDFYLMQLTTNAAQLAYATYFGSSSTSEHVDGGTSRFDKRGIVYQAVCAGCGGSSAFPTTPGAWSRSNNSSNCNNAAFKFDFEIANANPGMDRSVCANAAPFILPGFSPPGGTWSGNGVSPNGLFTPSPSLIGVQQLTYTYAVGTCVTSGTINLSVDPVPAPDFTGLSTDYCISGTDTVFLQGNPVGGVFSGPGIIGNMFLPHIAGTGTHTISYRYTNNPGCTATINKTVMVANIPQANAGADTAICNNASITLTGTPAGGTWNGTGVSSSGVFNPKTLQQGVYTLTYTAANGNCSSTDNVQITVNINKDATLSGLGPIYCIDASLISLTGSPVGGTFSGAGIVNGNQFNAALAGEGYHTIYYAYNPPSGCVSIDSQTTYVNKFFDLNISPIHTGCISTDTNLVTGNLPFTIKFNTPSTDPATYTWDFGDGTFSSEPAPEHTYVNEGIYTVTVSADFGNNCIVKKTAGTFDLKPIQLPNIFTPNNDGLNDKFEVNLGCAPLKLIVYNRWGAKVYENDDYQNNWSGDELTESIYYYHFTDKNGQTWKGWFEIIR